MRRECQAFVLFLEGEPAPPGSGASYTVAGLLCGFIVSLLRSRNSAVSFRGHGSPRTLFHGHSWVPDLAPAKVLNTRVGLEAIIP